MDRSKIWSKWFSHMSWPPWSLVSREGPRGNWSQDTPGVTAQCGPFHNPSTPLWQRDTHVHSWVKKPLIYWIYLQRCIYARNTKTPNISQRHLITCWNWDIWLFFGIVLYLMAEHFVAEKKKDIFSIWHAVDRLVTWLSLKRTSNKVFVK